ncbi:MAG: Bacteriohemerythrin [Firmicutes bacterium]|nr:Bacteriohemerythrin [Bacillota bacterium]
MAIKWHESLAVGVAEIDEQHQELFRRLNQLLEACNQGKGKESVRELVTFLQEYVVLHFAAEEKLQRLSGFPEYALHRAKHAEFMRAAGQLKFTLEEQGPTLSFIIAVNKVVVDWLVQHISKMDKDLGRFLAAKGQGK